MKRSWRRRKFVPPRTSLAGRNLPEVKETPVASPNPVVQKKRRTELQLKQRNESNTNVTKSKPVAAPVVGEREGVCSVSPVASSEIRASSSSSKEPVPVLTELSNHEAKAEAQNGSSVAIAGSGVPTAGSQLLTFGSQTSLAASQSKDASQKENSRGLHKYGVPQAFCNAYKRVCNIDEVFQWQAECLSNPKVISGEKNLVYRGPTSAGKSLVAEILLLLRMVEAQAEGRNPLVLFVAPYKSIVSEKSFFLQQILQPHFVVKAYSSDTSNSISGTKKTNLAVCTIEKASAILNFLINSSQEHRLVAVVFDEIHTACNRFPGFKYESLVSKCLRLQSTQKARMQIFAMSATITDIKLFARWLRAELYETRFRPLALTEYLVVHSSVFVSQPKSTPRIKLSREIPFIDDTSSILNALCEEAIGQYKQCVVFCESRRRCEEVALDLCRTLSVNITGSKFVDDITENSNDERLHELIRNGIAFHHAGITEVEKVIIEDGFRNNGIVILCCTSTLSAGVNLPASSVFILGSNACFNNVAKYRQMAGRAGRSGCTENAGESYLIHCKPMSQVLSEEEVAINMLNNVVDAKLTPVESFLSKEHAGLAQPILEAFDLGFVKAESDILSFMKHTLLWQLILRKSQMKTGLAEKAMTTEISTTLSFLTDHHCLNVQGPVAISFKGRAIAKSMEPEEGLIFYSLFLMKESYRRVYENEHLQEALWLVPLQHNIRFSSDSWLRLRVFVDRWREKESKTGKKSLKLVVIESLKLNLRYLQGECYELRFCELKAQQIPRSESSHEYQVLAFRMFFGAVLLEMIFVHKFTVKFVTQTFEIERGHLESFIHNCVAKSFRIASFCRDLGFNSHADLIESFRERFNLTSWTNASSNTTNKDLLGNELLRRAILDVPTAKVLNKAGICSLEDVAKAPLLKLLQLLRNAEPYAICSSSQRLKREGVILDTAKRLKATASKCNGASSQSKAVTEEVCLTLPREKLNERFTFTLSFRRMLPSHKRSKYFCFRPAKSSLDGMTVCWKENVLHVPLKDKLPLPAYPVISANRAVGSIRCICEVKHHSFDLQLFKGWTGTVNSPSWIKFSSENKVWVTKDGDPIEFHATNVTNYVFENPALLSKVVGFVGFKCFGADDSNVLSLVSKSWHRSWCVCYNGTLASLFAEVHNFFNNNSLMSSRDLSCEPSGRFGYCAPYVTNQVFALEESLDITLPHTGIDPLVAYWMLNPDYKPGQLDTLLDSHVDSLSSWSFKLSKLRARAICCKMSELENGLRDAGLWKTFCSVEMPSRWCVGEVEFSGVLMAGLNSFNCHKQVLLRNMELLEAEVVKKCYILKQRQFIEGKKPFNIKNHGHVNTLLTLLDPKRKRRKASDKSALQSVFHSTGSKIPLLILWWRKYEYTYTNWIQSMSNRLLSAPGEKRNQRRLKPVFNGYCKNGRINIQNPALQNTPKEMVVNRVPQKSLWQEVKDKDLSLSHFNTLAKSELIAAVVCLDGKMKYWGVIQSVHGSLCISEKKVNESGYDVDEESILSRWKRFGCKDYDGLKNLPFTVEVQLAGKEAFFLPADKVFRKVARVSSKHISDRVLDTRTTKDTAWTLTKRCYTLRVRNMIIPEPEDVLISVDYSQIELRLMTHFSKDQALIAAFSKGPDIFIELSKEWKLTRKQTKIIFYAMAYGQGVEEMAKLLEDDDMKRAHLRTKEIRHDFARRYPTLTKYLERLSKDSKSSGYVTSLLKRKIKCKKGASRFVAVNTKMQSSSADILKIVLANIHRSRQTELKRLKLVIHDELLLSVSPKLLSESTAFLSKIMTNAFPLAVPLQVKFKVGDSWGSMVPYDEYKNSHLSA